MYFDLCTVLKFFIYPFLLLLRSWPDKAGLCLSVSVSVRSQIVVLHFECDSLYSWMSAAWWCAMWPRTLWSRPRDVKVQISSISKVYPAAVWQTEDRDECPPPLQIPVRIFFLLVYDFSTCKIRCQKSVLGEYRDKIELVSTHDLLCQKFAAECLKIATFVTHDASESISTISKLSWQSHYTDYWLHGI